jgi:hypothetical protein
MDNQDVADPFRPESAANSLSGGTTSRKFPEPFVKPFTEPLGHLKQPSVTDQSYNISGAVEYRSAVRTSFEMRFHSFAHLGRDLFVEVIGDFPPYFDATDFNGRH